MKLKIIFFLRKFIKINNTIIKFLSDKSQIKVHHSEALANLRIETKSYIYINVFENIILLFEKNDKNKSEA
jgi:hypothetical protein